MFCYVVVGVCLCEFLNCLVVVLNYFCCILEGVIACYWCCFLFFNNLSIIFWIFFFLNRNMLNQPLSLLGFFVFSYSS